jgi:hypothetical protein
MKTGTLRPIEPSPRSADPHKYVRLNLKANNSSNSSSSSSKSKQKRLALRNIVAHCWLPGFRLTADGMLTGPLRVFQLNRDPNDCRAGNLMALTQSQAQQRGLALTTRQRTPRAAPAALQAAETAPRAAMMMAAAAENAENAAEQHTQQPQLHQQQQQQNPPDRGTPLALVQQACNKTPQDEQMVWPAGFHGQGLSPGGA